MNGNFAPLPGLWSVTFEICIQISDSFVSWGTAQGPHCHCPAYAMKVKGDSLLWGEYEMSPKVPCLIKGLVPSLWYY
jgi:hypothetical protein